jgi:hypothetical protein
VSRWLTTSAATALWNHLGGKPICCRTMQRILERWYDAGYSIGSIERGEGGYYSVQAEFLKFEKMKKLGQVGHAIEGDGGM